ncbi:MAG: response regulator transcription factor [Myxococcales bacterium]|nr:response regulator transcription factor [Myxococcales bacterium]
MTSRTLLLVDDHTLVREGMSLVLDRLPGEWKVRGVGSVEEAEEICAAEPVHLVLLDYHLPGVSGVDAFRRVQRSVAAGVPIVIITADIEASRVRRLLEAGAKGYILKASTAEVMLSALELVLAGGTYVPPEALLAASPDGPHLTAKQREVLALLVQGQSNKEIAASLGASESTVRTHLSAIFRTLGVQNRAQAVRVTLHQKLL